MITNNTLKKLQTLGSDPKLKEGPTFAGVEPLNHTFANLRENDIVFRCLLYNPSSNSAP